MTAPVLHRYQPRGAARAMLTDRSPELLLDGPAGCVAGETLLWDPVAMRGRRFDELCEAGERPWVQTLTGPVLAEVPFAKGVAPLYRVSYPGRSILVTADHLLLTSDGWRAVGRVTPGSFVLSGSPIDAHRSTRTGADSRAGCHSSRCLCDPLLPSGVVADRAFAPSRCGALEPGHACSPRDGQASTTARSRLCRLSARHSTQRSVDLRSVVPSGAIRAGGYATPVVRSRASSGTGGRDSLSSPLRLRLRQAWRQPLPSSSLSRGASRTHPLFRDASMSSDLPCSHYRYQWVPITDVRYERTDVFYDLHVPGEEHYLANGTYHHNTGKSRACLEKLLLCALKYPGMRALIVRQTLVSLSTSAMVTWQEHVAKEALATGQMTYYGGSRNEPAQYRLANGSRIMLAGMDKPSKIMSTEYDLIYVQELTELSLMAWLALSSRMRNPVMPYRQLLADCNPDAETHWVNQRANGGALKRLVSRHVDNPVYYHDDGTRTPSGEEYMARLDALTGVTRLRLRDGLWVSAEGVIYEGWQPGIHLLDHVPGPGGHVPLSWPRFWVIDFGYTNPFVWQDWARDPDGRLYLIREIYMTRRTVRQHCETIKRTLIRKDGTWVEPKPQKIICDHDAEDRATFEEEMGLSTDAATKTVKDGIDATMLRMVPAGDGKPRLFILRNALIEKDPALALQMRPTRTAEEFPVYVWNEAKDQPIKEHDHGMDAARYMVADQDLSPQYRIRWVG